METFSTHSLANFTRSSRCFLSDVRVDENVHEENIFIFIFVFSCSKKSVQQEIQLLIKQYPRRVRHIPDALSIFTRQAEQLTNAQVKYSFLSKKHFINGFSFIQSAPILTWQSINPVAALAYFASTRLNHMNNSYTIQYASRILYTTNPQAVILYIPQLVQAIRHDEVLFPS